MRCPFLYEDDPSDSLPFVKGVFVLIKTNSDL